MVVRIQRLFFGHKKAAELPAPRIRKMPFHKVLTEKTAKKKHNGKRTPRGRFELPR